MEKIKKYFPLMPAPKETGKLVLAILFYVYVPFIVASIASAILGITVILFPAAVVISSAASLYAIAGIVYAIMNYKGCDPLTKE